MLDIIDVKEVILNIGNGLGFLGDMNAMPVASCQYTQILNRTTEIVGTATLPIHRCKGFGAAITAFATKTALQNGAKLVCLSAADSKATRVYSKIGFKKIGTMLAYSKL